MPPVSHRIARFGVFEVNFNTRELRKEGMKVRVPEQSLQVLEILAEHPGDLISREELSKRLWPHGTFVDFEAGLNNAVKKLRDGLGDSAENPRFVETLPRRGYRFIAALDRSPVPSRPDIEDRPEPFSEVKEPKRAVLLKVLTVVVVGVLGTLLAVSINTRHNRVNSASTNPVGSIRSIAILPFENLSKDSGQDYLVESIHESLVTEMARIGSIRVTSRTSVLRYRGTKEPLPAIAKELGVDAIIEGAVARTGNRVRVTAQLIDARSDRHLWAESYDRDAGDLPTLQEELPHEIAGAAQKELLRTIDKAASRHVNAEAFDAYTAGAYAANTTSAEAYRVAIKYLEKSIELQPDYADAYAELAFTYYRHSWLGSYPPKDYMPKAGQLARKAMELDASVDAHFVLGTVQYRYDWDWAAADAEYERAKRMSMSNFGSPIYFQFLCFTGRKEEALKEATSLLHHDPLATLASENLGVIYFFSGRFEESADQFRTVLRVRPDADWLHYQLGRALLLGGHHQEAIAELETAVKLSKGNSRFVSYLGFAYATSGKTKAARHTLRELEQRSKEQYVSPYGIALIHVGLREPDAAFEWLEKAYEVHSFELAELTGDPRLIPLRSDPRFQDLARRVGPIKSSDGTAIGTMPDLNEGPSTSRPVQDSH